MSKEMKMSDVFELPFEPIDYQNGIVDCNGFAVLFSDMSDQEKTSLCAAINNHDTLTEQVRQLRKKEEKLNLYEALTGNCWDLVCVSYSHGDDSSYEWQVVGHYMSKPYKRVLGFTSNEDSPHEAIEHALETTKDSVYDYLYEFKD